MKKRIPSLDEYINESSQVEKFVIINKHGNYLKSFEYGGISSDWSTDIEEAKVFSTNDTAYNVMGYHLSREIAKDSRIQKLDEGLNIKIETDDLVGKFKALSKFVYRTDKTAIIIDKEKEFDVALGSGNERYKEVRISGNFPLKDGNNRGSSSVFIASMDWWVMINNNKVVKKIK